MSTNYNDHIWWPHKIRFTVTQEHIDAGNPGSACACPIALALEDRGWEARVDGFIVQLYVDGKMQEYRPSPRMTRFVWVFDNGETGYDEPVQPSTFVMERIDREEGYEQDYREWGP